MAPQDPSNPDPVFFCESSGWFESLKYGSQFDGSGPLWPRPGSARARSLRGGGASGRTSSSTCRRASPVPARFDPEAGETGRAVLLASPSPAGPASESSDEGPRRRADRGGGIANLKTATTVDVKTDLTREQLLEIIRDYDALIVRSQTMADAELIDKAQQPQGDRPGGDRPRQRRRRGRDTRTGSSSSTRRSRTCLSAAEHAMALMLAQARNIPAANASVKSGKWERGKFEGVELHGKTLAILGLGRIGTLVAQRALAFGMRVVAYDPYVAKQRAGQMGVELVATIDDALRAADFVTIHLPKTAGDRGADRRARAGADEAGRADREHLAAVGSSTRKRWRMRSLRGSWAARRSTFSRRSRRADSPLFGLDSVVLTPHLGASTEEAQSKAGEAIAEQVAARAAGRARAVRGQRRGRPGAVRRRSAVPAARGEARPDLHRAVRREHPRGAVLVPGPDRRPRHARADAVRAEGDVLGGRARAGDVRERAADGGGARDPIRAR